MSYPRATYVTIVLMIMLLRPISHGNLFAAHAAQSNVSTLNLGINLRSRYEIQNNFNQKYYGDEPRYGNQNDGFVLGRLRAGIDWRPVPKVHISLWGQSNDAWDYALADEAYYNKTFSRIHHPLKDRLELFKAYIEVTDIDNSGLTLKVGRQKIFYADNRVFGPGEWGNSGSWGWDGVKLSYKHSHGFIDLFYAKTMLHEINTFSLNHRHGYESLGLYAHVDLTKQAVTMVFEPMIFTKVDKHQNYSGEGNSNLSDLDTWYAGANVSASWQKFKISTTFLQENGNFSHDNINAFGYNVMLVYSAKKWWQAQFKIAYSYASGDHDPTDGKKETFHGAFGAKDKMYGRMNLFSWSNLKDIEAGVTLKPSKKLQVNATAHQFALAQSRDGWSLNSSLYRDKSGQSGTAVGKEVDLIISYKPFSEHKFMAGFARFWPDEFVEKMVSNDVANWAFVQWEYTYSSTLLGRK